MNNTYDVVIFFLRVCNVCEKKKSAARRYEQTGCLKVSENSGTGFGEACEGLFVRRIFLYAEKSCNKGVMELWRWKLLMLVLLHADW